MVPVDVSTRCGSEGYWTRRPSPGRADILYDAGRRSSLRSKWRRSRPSRTTITPEQDSESGAWAKTQRLPLKAWTRKTQVDCRGRLGPGAPPRGASSVEISDSRQMKAAYQIAQPRNPPTFAANFVLRCTMLQTYHSLAIELWRFGNFFK
jgi:hypothetical protein